MAIDKRNFVIIGTITGQVTNDELLGKYFANCIGSKNI
jgi:tRNA U34 5-carboxymethylaminomethyl modifying GTPase MnmE/TrmE